jgi:hypothetical protein
MDGQYILLICAGGVFILIFLLFIVTAIKTAKLNKANDNAIKQSYVGDNLRRMDYDLALYDGEEHNTPTKITTADSQLTIDEVLAEKEKTTEEEKPSDDALFTKIGNEGMEEITGNFDS